MLRSLRQQGLVSNFSISYSLQHQAKQRTCLTSKRLQSLPCPNKPMGSINRQKRHVPSTFYSSCKHSLMLGTHSCFSPGLNLELIGNVSPKHANVLIVNLSRLPDAKSTNFAPGKKPRWPSASRAPRSTSGPGSSIGITLWSRRCFSCGQIACLFPNSLTSFTNVYHHGRSSTSLPG